MSSSFKRSNDTASPARGKKSVAPTTTSNSLNPNPFDRGTITSEGGLEQKAIPDVKVDESESDVSSESSDASDSDAGRKDQKKKKNKTVKRHRDLSSTGFKVREPSIYNGTANHFVFEQWAFSVKLWKSALGLSNNSAVLHLFYYVSDKAMVFYMGYVAPNPTQWRLSAVFHALFDYCFPPDFESRLRKALMNSKQGTKPFKFFAHEVRSVAERYDVMTPSDINETLWNGAAPHVRAGWIEAGCSRESTPVENLVELAYRFEAAETLTCLKQENIHFVPYRGGWEFDQRGKNRDHKKSSSGKGGDKAKKGYTGDGPASVSDREAYRRKSRKAKSSMD